MGRSSLESVSQSVVASLERNEDIFSPVCDSEIETIEDGTCAVEVRPDWF